MTSKEDVENAVTALGPRLDLLINNVDLSLETALYTADTRQAAVEGLGPLLDTDPTQMMEMYRINVVAPLMLVKAFSAPLIAAKGCIVNIGSVGVTGLPFHGVYASSKVGPSSCSVFECADLVRRHSRRSVMC